MYVVFDFKCMGCDRTEERMIPSSARFIQKCKEADCTSEGEMIPLPAGTRTDFLHADTKRKA